jgi:hypothetical protein
MRSQPSWLSSTLRTRGERSRSRSSAIVHRSPHHDRDTPKKDGASLTEDAVTRGGEMTA